MKFVILLLAFFIPLLTSTGALNCYKCRAETSSDCITLKGMKGESCTGPKEKYCMTWFSAAGKLVSRDCRDPDPTNTFLSGITNYEVKTGCQSLKNRADEITKYICYCDKDDCNVDTTAPSGSGSTGDFNKSKGNTCKIVGMSLTTLLGGVLALLLIK